MTIFRESMVFLTHPRKSLTSILNTLKRPRKEIIAYLELNKTYFITLHFPQVQVSGILKVLTSTISSKKWSESNIESAASQKLLPLTCTTLSFGNSLAIGRTTRTTCSCLNLRMQALDWSRWTAPLIASCLSMVFTAIVICQFVTPISVFYIEMKFLAH